MLRPLAIAGLVAAGLTSQAFGWARVGHEAIGYIADDLLTPEARAEIDALLALEGADTLADVASWADEVKGEEKWAHVVRLELDDPSFDADDCPGRRCLVFGIEDNLAILQDTSRSDEERLEALKFIVHFVGDIHMPLHVVAKDLNRAKAQYRGRNRTIHKVWDALIINDTGLSARDLADAILLEGRTQGIPTNKPGDWAIESRDIARELIIPHVEGRSDRVRLSDDYGAASLPAIKDQLGKAGSRLADVLNEALADAP
jgi:hypothetical protein